MIGHSDDVVVDCMDPEADDSAGSFQVLQDPDGNEWGVVSPAAVHG